MDIKSVNSQLNTFTKTYTAPQEQIQSVQSKSTQITDKLEISKEARVLQSKDITAKDYSKIHEKINSGFYNSKEVLSKTSELILNDINKN
ncbi:MAG: hypothetical protein V1773_07445 [bacterium]